MDVMTRGLHRMLDGVIRLRPVDQYSDPITCRQRLRSRASHFVDQVVNRGVVLVFLERPLQQSIASVFRQLALLGDDRRRVLRRIDVWIQGDT